MPYISLARGASFCAINKIFFFFGDRRMPVRVLRFQVRSRVRVGTRPRAI